MFSSKSFFCYGAAFLMQICVIVHGSLPDYIHVCHRSDPQINECILKSTEFIRPKLRDGIPELNVPPIEPLRLGNIYLTRGPQSTRVNLNITRVKAWGPSTFNTTSVSHNIEKNLFEFKVVIPNLNFKGRYSINMNVLLLQLKGRGSINGNFSNFILEAKMQGRKIMKNETEHLYFDQIRLRLSAESTLMKLDGLFGQDPILNKIANDILENNSDIFFEEIRPALEHSLGDVLTKITNGITGSFTYDELFPL